MTQPSAEERLLSLWGEIRDLTAAEGLLAWDQETYMPAGGIESRAKVMATLAGIKHAKLTDPELADAVAACEEEAEPGSVLAAQAYRARREVDRAAKVPARLTKALAQATSTALASWQRARAGNDFSLFRKDLARVLELTREEAAALANGGGLYDALLDLYEPGATEAELEPLFAELKRELVPLVRAAAGSGIQVDDSPIRGNFPRAQQLEFGMEIARAMGFDFERGRLDASAHPFCSGIAAGDTRMTWRWQENDLRPALFGIVHETGHGLYEQGIPREWRRTPIGHAISLGIHESQSRLWENQVARGRPFWQWALPRLQSRFGDKNGVDIDQIWPALHTVTPSLIRVEADEATYNLHIVVRFELEKALIHGDLEVDELPAAWIAGYRELLGIEPRNDANGVLQDIHWAMGAFGYFPTYTLGTLAAAQLYEAAEAAIPDLDSHLAAGKFSRLLNWLRENIHVHGARYDADDLVRMATGKPLDPRHFLKYLRGIVQEIYGV